MTGIIHNIDPKLKNEAWVLKGGKWIWEDAKKATGIFYHKREWYNIVKTYVLGRQSVEKYKKIFKEDDQSDKSWMAIDYTPINIGGKFRRNALSKMSKIDYNIILTPIDSNSNDERDDYFAQEKAKLMLKQGLSKVNPQLAGGIQTTAKDMEHLNMVMTYGYKNQKAIEGEEGVKLIFYQNDIEEWSKVTRESLFDWGPCVSKDWIDSNGAVRFRAVDARKYITSYCTKADFSDALYGGEVKDMDITELKQAAGDKFTTAQYEEISNMANKGRGWNSPGMRDALKFPVLDFEFYSYNDIVRESNINKKGNPAFSAASYGDNGEKYLRKSVQVVYKGCWIIGTDFIYDCGLATDMKRAKSSMQNTSMSFSAYAPEFFEMTALGIMEQLLPLYDNLNTNWFRLQNSMNKAIPKGYEIDLDALEDVALGKGGAIMTPLDLIDMYEKTGRAVIRKQGISRENVNYKAITEMENGMGNDVKEYWIAMQNDIQMIRDITGVNELTDGSTPNPKATEGQINTATEGSNNAMYHISAAEKKCRERLAANVILRLQDAVIKTGGVSGYVQALGSETMRFIKVGMGIADAEFGIMTESKPTAEQKAMLQGQLQEYLKLDLLDLSDSIEIEDTWNLKHAKEKLAYKVKQRREEKQQEAMQLSQQNANVQIQSAKAAETAKQATMKIEWDRRDQNAEIVGSWMYEAAKLKVAGDMEKAVDAQAVKLITHVVPDGNTTASLPPGSGMGQYSSMQEQEEGQGQGQEGQEQGLGGQVQQ